MILHIVSKSNTQSDALHRCLSIINEQDQILLIQDGVYIGINPEKLNPYKCVALIDDVKARGLMNKWNNKIELIDYAKFVTLTESAVKIISWF